MMVVTYFFGSNPKPFLFLFLFLLLMLILIVPFLLLRNGCSVCSHDDEMMSV